MVKSLFLVIVIPLVIVMFITYTSSYSQIGIVFVMVKPLFFVIVIPLV